MAVMNMLMPVVGLIKVRYRTKADIDSFVFKLHYRTTATILFICCILVTANDLIGKTIDCMSTNIPGNVLNTYCWILSTFSVPTKSNQIHGQDNAYPGVEPLGPGTHQHDSGERVVHAYYQWVPFVLFLQGLLFYIPHWLWKTFEDRKLNKITDGLRGRTLNLEDRKEKCDMLVTYTVDTLHTHNFYALKFFICDALNMVNVIGQMFLINKFLGGVFMTYGTEVLKWSESEPGERTDPMIDVFPRITKCTFYKYGPSGTLEHHDAMCVLALNIINEKIFVTIWFWFIVLAIVTFLYCVYVIAVITVPGMRITMLERNAKHDLKDRTEVLKKRANFGDWFLLFLLSKNLDSVLFKDYMIKLTDKLKIDGPNLVA